MSDEPTPSPASISAGYEKTDVESKPLMLFALVLAIVVSLACFVLIWLFGLLEREAERHDPRLSPLVGGQTPPEPRLQTSPANDLARMRAAEDRALSGYRWIDKERGVVQLSIERAMELLLDEGLPETQAEVPPLGLPPGEEEGQR